MSSDCCPIDTDLDGFLIRVNDRTARKVHRCADCHAEIPVGTRYRTYTGICDCWIYTAKHCIPCAGIARDFFPGGLEFGAMRQDFFDCQGFDYLGEWKDDHDAA